MKTCFRSRPKRKQIALKNARCLSSSPRLLSGDFCQSRTSSEFIMENATRMPVDMKLFTYCSWTNGALSIISPPAKSMPFLMSLCHPQSWTTAARGCHTQGWVSARAGLWVPRVRQGVERPACWRLQPCLPTQRSTPQRHQRSHLWGLSSHTWAFLTRGGCQPPSTMWVWQLCRWLCGACSSGTQSEAATPTEHDQCDQCDHQHHIVVHECLALPHRSTASSMPMPWGGMPGGWYSTLNKAGAHSTMEAKI